MFALTQPELRVFACLLEYSITFEKTGYPNLSAKQLLKSCNQKSNRLPLLTLTLSDIHQALDKLETKVLVVKHQDRKDKVDKYHQRFFNGTFSQYQLSQAQLAVLAELMLRGPQTPGSIKARGSRLHQFQNKTEVVATIKSFDSLFSDPIIQPLPKQPGDRGIVFKQTFHQQRNKQNNFQTSSSIENRIG